MAMPQEEEERLLSFDTFKKPIIEGDDNPPSISNPPPQAPRMLPPPPKPNPPPANNKEVSKMFFKTRLCVKFQCGSCPYGNTCNFAHGPEDLRRPPPNWQEIVATQGGHGDDRATRIWSDQQSLNRLKICRKFYRGEGCPYGDKCTFLHELPGEVRESSAIRVGTTTEVPEAAAAAAAMPGPGGDRRWFENPKNNGFFVGPTNRDGSRPCQKFFLKTKTCHKWETTGCCPYGDSCIFLHGSADLKKPGGAMDVECTNTVVAHMKHLPSPDYVSQSKRELTINPQQQQQPKGFLRWKGHKRINRIYGDWLDDMQPGDLCDSHPSKKRSD